MLHILKMLRFGCNNVGYGNSLEIKSKPYSYSVTDLTFVYSTAVIQLNLFIRVSLRNSYVNYILVPP